MATRKPARAPTRGERVIAFIERYCVAPDGARVGKPLVLDEFQRRFILAIYDNPAGTRRAFLSIARKNGKTALIAGILLAHLCGPEARLNSQIVSGAMSRDQAAVVFDLASKMVLASPDLSRLVRIVPSSKRLIGLSKNVDYRALSAEGKTAHGLSPVLAILDEVGQVRGPKSDFIDAITTAQGAHETPLLIAISTQAPNDADLFSVWLDDAKASADKRIVCHVYAAPEDCELDDREAWKVANPALGKFRSLADLEEQAERAQRMPSFEPTFRNLGLNQRVETFAPFISKGVWLLNSREPAQEAFYGPTPVFGGLDLSGKVDLTSLVLIVKHEGVWQVRPYFWTPEKGLRDRAKRDRTPYDAWAREGYIRTTPGAAIDYEVVARDILDALEDVPVQAIGFDRWRIDLLKQEFAKLGATPPLVPFGQGMKSMSPAVETLETELLNERIAHGNHPVLASCMRNVRIERDAAGERKMTKAKSTGRIDGAVALTMAFGVAPTEVERPAEPAVFFFS